MNGASEAAKNDRANAGRDVEWRSAALADLAAKASVGIDSKTGLASDFLNQFNEVSMLLDMVCDDTELIEELEDWQPLTYVEHFEQSRFGDSDLVIAAYRLCPEEQRIRFDRLTGELGKVIRGGLDAIRTAGIESDCAAGLCRSLAADVRGRIELLSAIIHPADKPASNAAVSAMFAAHR